ncbi:MAG: SpoIIE family protein phosphatase [Eubacteriales bacterium]
MSLQINTYTDSINKFGEELCGNKAELYQQENGVIAILADGLGSGVKANMLASLTIKMFTSMLQQSEYIEDAIETIIDSQPIDANNNYYSSFSIIRILNNGMTYIAEVNMPEAVFLRKGKPIGINMCKKFIKDKAIKTGNLTLKPGDILTIFSNGVVNAGIASNYKSGWQWELVAAYLKAAYKPQITAEKLTKLLLSASSWLDNNKPNDDLSVFTFQISKTPI